jgi:hypothetical protein
VKYPKRLIEVDLPIEDFGACEAREVDPAWAYIDTTYLVGSKTARGLPCGPVRCIMAGPGGRALPSEVPGRRLSTDQWIRGSFGV